MSIRISRYTASLSAILIAVALLALFFSRVRGLVPVPGKTGVPQGGDSVLYEVAEASDDLAIRVGPNRFSVAAVARNDRDGTVRVEDGRGATSKGLGFTPNAAVPGQAGWLDVANVYLNPDPSRFDVIELRVFDHATRKLITHDNGMGSRYYPSSPPVVQLLSSGKLLPGSVDVWFRAASYERGEPVVSLKGEAGASVAVAKGTLSIREVRRGSLSYSTRSAPGSKRTEYLWVPSPSDTDRVCTVVFDWGGDWGDRKSQICAVGRDARKVFPDIPHFLKFDAEQGSQAISFKIAEANLSHFEVRPFGDRRTFYFENVRLPKVSSQPFREAPSVRLPVDGGEVERYFSEFSPVRVRMSLKKGACCNGISSDGFMTPTKPVERLDSAFTVFLDVEGIASDLWELTYTDRDGKPLDVRAGGRTTRYVTNGHSEHHEAATYDIPLKRIGAIEVRPVR